MGYKFKPNKGVAKRMRLTATGKLKHRHEKNSHLRSRRNASLKRRLGRPGVLSEGLARNMRRLLGETGTRPNQIAAERARKK
jgi:large subunit ribosomal protein L35